MPTTVWGIVIDGRVVPSTPLPEGAHVEIRLADSPSEVPEDLWCGGDNVQEKAVSCRTTESARSVTDI